MESRAEQLASLQAERFGDVKHSWEYGRAQVIADIFWLAAKCEITPEEEQGRCFLRYGVAFKDLDRSQLWEEYEALQRLKNGLDHPAGTSSVPDFNDYYIEKDPIWNPTAEQEVVG